MSRGSSSEYLLSPPPRIRRPSPSSSPRWTGNLFLDFLPRLTLLMVSALSGQRLLLLATLSEVTSWSLESPDSCRAYVWNTGGGGGHGGPPSDSDNYNNQQIHTIHLRQRQKTRQSKKNKVQENQCASYNDCTLA